MAVKVVSASKHHKAALYEYQISKNLDHPNVVGTIDWFDELYLCSGNLF